MQSVWNPKIVAPPLCSCRHRPCIFARAIPSIIICMGRNPSASRTFFVSVCIHRPSANKTWDWPFSFENSMRSSSLRKHVVTDDLLNFLPHIPIALLRIAFLWSGRIETALENRSRISFATRFGFLMHSNDARGRMSTCARSSKISKPYISVLPLL